MTLPREILDLILSHAEPVYTRCEFVALRLVDTHFDQEVLSVLFSAQSSGGRGRFINGNNFPSAPASLRRKYLLFKLRRQHVYPSVFAYLFQPVYEQWVRSLGITADDKVRREEALEELLRLVEHRAMTAWVASHKREHFEWLKRKALRCSTTEAGEEAVLNAARERQVQRDTWYLYTVRALLDKDDSAFLTLLRDEHVEVHCRNLCFGGTISSIAVRHGSLTAVRAVLDATKNANADKPLYRFFALAAERPDDWIEATSLLLDPIGMRRTAAEHVKILKCFFRRACTKGHVEVLRAYLRWTEENWKPTNTLKAPEDLPDFMTDMYTYTLPAGTSSRGEHLESQALWWLDRTQHKKYLFNDGFRDALLIGNSDVIKLLATYVNPSEILEGHQTIVQTLHFYRPAVKLLNALLELVEVPRGIQQGWAWNTLQQAISWDEMDWVDALLARGVDPRYYKGTRPLFYDHYTPERREKAEALLAKHGWDVGRLEVDPATGEE